MGEADMEGEQDGKGARKKGDFPSGVKNISLHLYMLMRFMAAAFFRFRRKPCAFFFK
jgi:hypothetical protein